MDIFIPMRPYMVSTKDPELLLMIDEIVLSKNKPIQKLSMIKKELEMQMIKANSSEQDAPKDLHTEVKK